MNHPYFTELRRQIDTAITFHDLDAARQYTAEGLRLAQDKECLGEVMYFRAQEEVIAERFASAIALLRKAIAFNPTDGAAYNDIALCMVELGQIEGVLEVFDQGITVEPDYATIHHNKGWLLNQLGRPTEALVCFETAIRLEPERVVTWENMASAYEALERIPEALDAYKKALSFLHEPISGIREQLEAEIERLGKIKGAR